MTKLDELNLKLIEHDSKRESILYQISNQIDLEELSQFDLVGKCFERNDDSFQFYKILKLHYVDGNKISIDALCCDIECIKVADIYHIQTKVDEIELIDFNLKILELSVKLLKK